MSSLLNFLSTHPTPTFLDNFPGSAINASNWAVQTYSANLGAGNEPNLFAANSIVVSAGVLQMRLSQNATSSLSAQIQSQNTFGYGLYQYTMRMGSNSATPTGVGTSFAGGVSAGFSYWQITNGIGANASITEIDWEVEGQYPSQLEMTTWNTQANPNQQTLAAALRTSDAFHTYSYLWLPNPLRVEYYFDGLLISTHFTVVTTTPALMLLEHWGSNSLTFGGLRSAGISRYLYCSQAEFYAL